MFNFSKNKIYINEKFHHPHCGNELQYALRPGQLKLLLR